MKNIKLKLSMIILSIFTFIGVTFLVLSGANTTTGIVNGTTPSTLSDNNVATVNMNFAKSSSSTTITKPRSRVSTRTS